MTQPALREFDILQVGEESTKGTLVAATVQIKGDTQLTEGQDFYRDDYPADSIYEGGGEGVITRQFSEFETEMDLTAEEMMWPLHSGIRGAVTGVQDGADAEYTWTFTPENQADRTLDSFTAELIRGVGSSNIYAQEFGYCLTRGFDIDWSQNQRAVVRWRWFGRAKQTTTPTAALATITGREPLITPLLAVYSDDAWGSLGGTQLATVVRSGRLSVETGVMPDYTADQRSDKDFTQHIVGDKLKATLELVLELNSSGYTESFTDYRANDIRFIRLDNQGSTLDDDPRYFQMDGAWRFTAEPRESNDGSVRLVTCSFELIGDPADLTRGAVFALYNALSSL